MSGSLAPAFLRLARAMLATSRMQEAAAVRAAALLGRQALEHDVAARLASQAPGAEAASQRAQLLCLHAEDEETGEAAAHLWWAFTRACHVHPYELSPTTDEVAALLDALEQLHETLRTPVETPSIPARRGAMPSAGGES